jgi:hypothetical protein
VANELAKQTNAPTLDFSKIDPKVMTRAAAIAASVQAAGGQIHPAQALADAFHFEQTGEVMGRHSYIGKDGNVTGVILEGYRGVARQLDMSKYQWRYRPLTDEERMAHNVQDGDKALICELTVLAARRQCIEMGIEYQPIMGFTLTHKGESIRTPANRDQYWVLCKRARTDALRQVGENTSAEDVLEEANVEAPEGYLSVEQAEEYVRSKVIEAIAAQNRENMTPETAAAKLEELGNAMHGDSEQDPFADQPPPEQLRTQRPADPMCPECGGLMWNNIERKAQGTIKPNAPDYKCRNKECKGVYWPGQWPPAEKPSEAQVDTFMSLVRIVYPSKEDKPKFKQWFANSFVDIDTANAKTVKDLVAKLTPTELQAGIVELGKLRDMLEAIEEEPEITPAKTA